MKHCTNPKCQPFCICAKKCNCAQCQKYRSRHLFSFKGTDLSRASAYQKGSIKFETNSNDFTVHTIDEGNFTTRVIFEQKDYQKIPNDILGHLLDLIEQHSKAIKKQEEVIACLEKNLTGPACPSPKENKNLEERVQKLEDGIKACEKQKKEVLESLIAYKSFIENYETPEHPAKNADLFLSREEVEKINAKLENLDQSKNYSTESIENLGNVVELLEETLAKNCAQIEGLHNFQTKITDQFKVLENRQPGNLILKSESQIETLMMTLDKQARNVEGCKKKTDELDLIIANEKEQKNFLLQKYEEMVEAMVGKGLGCENERNNFSPAATPTGKFFQPDPLHPPIPIFRMAKELSIDALPATAHQLQLPQTEDVCRIVSYGGCFDSGDGTKLPIPYFDMVTHAFLFINNDGVLQLDTTSSTLREQSMISLWFEFTF